MSQYKDHGKLKWVVFCCAAYQTHLSFSKSTLGSIGVGGDLDLSERPAVGPDSISSTLRDQIGIKSRHLRDPLVVASFTASSRDLRGRKFWESCKFRKFPRSTLERGVIRFMKTSHSHSMSQQYEPEMFSYFLTLCSCTWAVNWLKIRVNRGMQSMV